MRNIKAELREKPRLSLFKIFPAEASNSLGNPSLRNVFSHHGAVLFSLIRETLKEVLPWASPSVRGEIPGIKTDNTNR